MGRNMGDDYDDKKILRRMTFISNNERVETLYQSELKFKGWDKGVFESRVENLCNPQPGGPPLEYHRALRDTDVLEHIAKYLQKDDLLNCRLVCRLWSTEMAMFMYKRRSLIVVNEHCTKADTLIAKRISGDPITLNTLSLFDISAECPLFKRLFLHFGWTLNRINVEDCGLSPKDLKSMLVDKAPNLAHLWLRENESRSKTTKSTFKQIKRINKGKLLLPKMKFLYWDEENGSTSLEDIYEACPNLVTLEMRKMPVPKPEAFKGVKWDSLRTLFLSPRNVLSEEHCNALINLQLQLNRLTLFGIDPCNQRTMKSLSKFLETLSTTLVRLEMWLDYPSIMREPQSKNYSPFPVNLPKLESLHTETSILGNLEYLNRLSSMTELEVVVSHISAHGDWSSVTRRCAKSPQCNLKTIKCGEIDELSLVKVMRSYPNITSLHLESTYVNDKVFRKIVKALPELTELTISPSSKSNLLKLTDTGFTGVSKAICKKYLKNPEIEPRNFDQVPRNPGIGDLRNLQTLNLSFQAAELTDASTFFGISKLTSVRSLKYPCSRITDLSLAIIGQNLRKLYVLGVTGCQRLTKEGIDNLKRERPPLHVEGDNSPFPGMPLPREMES